jgi:hypothetical protein
MINLLNQITPLTKGILWLTNGEMSIEKKHYKEVDYLLNGLLTATLKNSNSNQNNVILGENFGNTFFVFVGTSISENELRSYFELVKPHVSGESDLLLIDELESFHKIQKIAPEEIKTRIHVL